MVDDDKASGAPPAIRPNGQFAPGNKISKGRAKGSKNKTTLLREAMEKKMSRKISKIAPNVLNVVAEAALKGDLQAAKMILDRAQSVKKAGDESAITRDTTITVEINNLANPHAPVVGVTIEGSAVASDEE